MVLFLPFSILAFYILPDAIALKILLQANRKVEVSSLLLLYLISGYRMSLLLKGRWKSSSGCCLIGKVLSIVTQRYVEC